MMRTAMQMMTIIKAVAESDPRVRAVYMNGSRANPNSHPDLFQDFDIVYVTTDIAGMLAERSWLAPLWPATGASGAGRAGYGGGPNMQSGNRWVHNHERVH